MGPGGAAAVLRDGEVLECRVWGYASLERRIPFTARTLVPACSITKQFLCGALLSRLGEPERLDGEIAACLPRFTGPLPTARQLCNNQSGLRDYWAQTVLCGAHADGDLRPHQAMDIIARMETGHFAPGAHYSYANPNFRILEKAMERVTGQELGTLMRQEVFDPVGMEAAALHSETACLPGGACGYEGTLQTGLIPAKNLIHWAGDAGVCASLADFIAWERFIHATDSDQNGLYNRLSAPQSFADGSPAWYTFGLLHGARAGRSFTEHGGGLRGWSLHRLHCGQEKLSIVVMLNHRAVAARSIVMRIFDTLVGLARPAGGPVADESWLGSYLDLHSGLLLDVRSDDAGGMLARFEAGAEHLTLTGRDKAAGEYMRLYRDGDRLRMCNARDNLTASFVPLKGAAAQDFEGSFHCAELDARFTCGLSGGVLYGAFDGPLGAGPMQLVEPVGRDVWRMPCVRAMDAAAPGDWTIRLTRDEVGRVSGFSIGCWLSRSNYFKRREGRA